MTKTLGDITRELHEKVLAPARAEADEVLAAARKESGVILSGARAEAEKIKAEAAQEVEHLRARMDVDMETAARNFVMMVKEKLEAAVVKPLLEKEMKAAFSDTEFLKKTVELVLTEFAKSRGTLQGIELLLPEKQKSEIEAWLVGKLRDRTAAGLTVHFTDKISFGFRIGAGEEGASYNFSSGLVEAFAAFCSPRFRKYFFRNGES